MMPVYVCKDCKREFGGWGAKHKMSSGKGLSCPECNGALVDRKKIEVRTGQKKTARTKAA